MPFFQSLKKYMLHILSCCDRDEPTIQIGYPTDFRRQDVTFEGLTEEQQAFIRNRARLDAAHPPSPITPFFQEQSMQEQTAAFHGFDRLKQHTRRLSAKVCNYGIVYRDDQAMGSEVMLRDQKVGLGFEDGFGRGEWPGRDSVTLGGSEREGSEKGSGRG
ncbi:hypothetical protein EJ08DRAFT_701061 [Tothia fuscella]|uniref:Uncharacterized protein n=1 Tax=Tothia fuscella TaxID=1048955 RepID=A0A9P4NIV2_9PEZI|nr:hypothetical protein EJ08DRAFT_701061 [Tothia fuscella]